ncbi:MAG TPA: hypothetical protein VF800_02820 [Telluria sp.]|jgi:hypothetical protein
MSAGAWCNGDDALASFMEYVNEISPADEYRFGYLKGALATIRIFLRPSPGPLAEAEAALERLPRVD